MERLKHGTVEAEMIGGGCICVPDTHTGAIDGSETLLVFVGVTLGLRGAQKRALEGPIFRSVRSFGGAEAWPVDAEMIKSGCICVPDAHTDALYDSGTLLVFVGGDFGLERGSK